ncbi:AbfB domain-containing protein [Streptomyces antibioticus]|uniref:AbfB domain-containing protein n=1 Tax=Streptomyces antibioticus TaxID=1890 RepID=UPI0036933258
MPREKSRPPQEEPWENGWAPDTSRAPGTRRLWLAGALAVATVAACVTAIALNDEPAGEATDTRGGKALSDDETGGLISFPSSSADASPSGSDEKGGMRPENASPSAGEAGEAGKHSASPRPQGSPSAHASASAPGRKPTPSVPASADRSVSSVNYPDRYWHIGGGLVRLDPARGSESRQDSTFTVVKGLADSACYSFATADGTYLRHRDFVLRSERSDGSSLFRQDATFCARSSPYSGAVMLESVNYPGRFLRHQNFRIRLDAYQDSDLFRMDASFFLVAGLD